MCLLFLDLGLLVQLYAEVKTGQPGNNKLNNK